MKNENSHQGTKMLLCEVAPLPKHGSPREKFYIKNLLVLLGVLVSWWQKKENKYD
jgi:hypothetical protein